MLKLKFFISFILLTFGHQVLSQDANDLLQRARSERMSDLDSSNWYATQAYRKALQTNMDEVAIQAQLLLGRIQQMQGNLDEAITFYKNVLSSTSTKFYQEDHIQAHGRIGDCYTDLGSFDSAMVFLILFDQLVDEHWGPIKIDAKLLLGELYHAMGRLDRSDDFKTEAIERSEKSGNKMERTIALYYYLDDHKNDLHTAEFQKYFLDYMTLKDQQKDSHSGHSHVTMLMEGLSESEKIIALEKAISEGANMGYLSALLYYRAALIEIYIEGNDLNNAIKHAEQGLIETTRIDHKRYEANYHKYLFQIHEKLKNYDKAIHHLESHHLIKDKLENSNISRNIDELNIQYQTSIKEKQIIQQELALQQNKYQRNFLLGGLAMALWLGVFLAIYFWNRNRVTKRLARQETLINDQKIRQLEQEKSLLAMSSMIEGQEVERKRIAQDLHDGLGGLLSSFKAQIHDTKRRVGVLSGTDVYRNASNMIDEASKEVRRIAYNMMPVALSRLGLKAAIEDMASRISSHHALDIDLQLFGLNDRMDENSEVMIYRIIQELCNNVVKHASAKSLMIQTNKIENDLVLVIEDDGHGFNPSDVKTKNGVGMRSLSSRVKYLKGSIDIASSENGTCVTVLIPLHK